MSDKIILLVEDNPDNEALTLRALKKTIVTLLDFSAYHIVDGHEGAQN